MLIWLWACVGGEQKRHKGALASAATAKGSRGVLVTCDKTKERQSVRDALNLLNDAADRFFPRADGAKSEDEAQEEEDAEAGESVQQKLAAEVAALRQDAAKRQTGRFTALDTVCCLCMTVLRWLH